MYYKKSKYIICILIITFFLTIQCTDFTLAFNNSPDGSNSETPDKRKYFNFNAEADSSGTFQKSHYSSHDWIADAALRLLIDESSTGAQDWNWLLDTTTKSQISPKWINQYGDRVNHHRVRSYISFIFATQMPDMNPKKINNARPHKHPVTIDCWWEEGEIIGNGGGMGKWVGRSDYQDFHWKTIDLGNGMYTFAPKGLMRAPEYAYRTAKKAIECLTHEEKNENNEYELWAKPESAACWLGVMTHFIADLAAPPHLIQEKDGYYPKSPDFHNWFENQVAKLTLWDSTNAGPKGYTIKNNFFNVDMAIISQDAHNIIPISPSFAALAVATSAIEKSYGHIDEGGLFIEKDNSQQQNLIIFGSSSYWNWGDSGKERNNYNPIVSGGLTYKEYYDKVEYLLNLAVYYTAAAMKWSIEEVKKKNNDQVPDCEQWARQFYAEKYPLEIENRPVENPPGLDQTEDTEFIRDYSKNYKPNIIIILSLMAPILGLVVVPVIIYSVLEKFKTK